MPPFERLRHRLPARLAGIAAATAAAPAAMAALPFWVTAGLMRRLAHWLPLEPVTLPLTELLEPVAELGWRSRPNLDAYGRADDRFDVSIELFHLTTDENGWRGQQALDTADAVIFGDGFAFGHGASDADMYAAQTGDLSAKSLGSDGYSMVHTVISIERLGQQLGGKTVVWMVYLGNDLYDNLRPYLTRGRQRAPYVRRRNDRWEIHTSHVAADPWPFKDVNTRYDVELAKICTPGYESTRALDAAAYLIDRAHQASTQAGARLVIMSVPRGSQINPLMLTDLRAKSPQPDRFDPNLPDRSLASFCERLDVPFIALMEHLGPGDYQPGDHLHWEPRGHAKVGALIGDACRSR